MLQPKRTRFRKAHKGRIHGNAKGGTQLSFGAFGLKAVEPERVTARQIEAARRAITRHMKRAGRVWVLIFPDVPVSKKPACASRSKSARSSARLCCRSPRSEANAAAISRTFTSTASGRIYASRESAYDARRGVSRQPVSIAWAAATTPSGRHARPSRTTNPRDRRIIDAHPRPATERSQL